MHFEDLRTDLLQQMRRLAQRLRLVQAEQVTAELADEASFEAMRERAAELAPNAQGILRDPTAFFREGQSGTGVTELNMADLNLYHERVVALAPPSLLSWLHRRSSRRS